MSVPTNNVPIDNFDDAIHRMKHVVNYLNSSPNASKRDNQLAEDLAVLITSHEIKSYPPDLEK